MSIKGPLSTSNRQWAAVCGLAIVEADGCVRRSDGTVTVLQSPCGAARETEPLTYIARMQLKASFDAACNESNLLQQILKH